MLPAGEKSGKGVLKLYDKEHDRHYTYFEGLFQNDHPFEGTVYSPQGAPVIRYRNGVLDHSWGQESTKASSLEEKSSDHQEQWGPRKTRFESLSRLPVRSEAIKGKTPHFDPSIPPEEVCPLIMKKMRDPSKALRLDESIELLTVCIQYGLERASHMAGEEAIIVIGNTGAGKSTFVNYLAGCTMKFVRCKDLGISGIGKTVVVASKREGGSKDELMPIGHEKESKTFMPQIMRDEDEGLTFCDCPGFLDNRGEEINISNAVNVKNALAQAKGVKVVILINYHSLMADRGKGLSDMLTICSSLFGHAENIIKHQKSLLLGVTKVPQDTDLEELSEWLVKDTPEVMQELAKSLFIYDPLDQELDGSLKRAECVAKIKAMPAIRNPSAIFKTVLTAQDEKKLLEIGEGMKEEVEKALVRRDYANASARLRHLESLGIIEHRSIERMLDQAFYHIASHFHRLVDEFRTQCHFEYFDQAKELLGQFDAALLSFDARLKDVIPLDELKGYYHESKRRSKERLQRESEQLEKLKHAQGQIQELLKLLEEQKQATQEELSRQKGSFSVLMQEMQGRIKETESSYKHLEASLKQELQERLAQKEEELRRAKELGQQQLDLEQQKQELERSYNLKLEQNSAQQKKLIEKQQRALKAKEKEHADRENELRKKIEAIEVQKQSQTRQLRNLQTPSVAMGKAVWERYFGDVGEEPPLPSNIHEILESQCPYWPDKKVKETHLLVLIPKSVNGKSFTVELLEKLIENPIGGGNATKYFSFGRVTHNWGGAPNSYWILFTKKPVKDFDYDNQKREHLLLFYKTDYGRPRLLEATTSICMHYVSTGERLYGNRYTECEEQGAPGSLHIQLGGFKEDGIRLGRIAPSGTLAFAGVRRF